MTANHKIKAAFFDIDGTLLSFRTHRVSKGTVEAFEQLHSQGILTFLATGRPKSLLPEMPLRFDGYVLMNGAYCYVGDRVLVRRPIHGDDVKQWLEYCRRNRMSTMAFTEEHSYANAYDQSCVEINRQMGIGDVPMLPLDTLGDSEVFQLLAVQGPEADAATTHLLPHCRLPRWHPLFCDIIPADISKAVGIAEVIELLHIDRSETIAFGDGQNDIEMLQLAGIGVAMGNAAPEVKAHADHVTTSVDDEGILTALRQLHIL